MSIGASASGATDKGVLLSVDGLHKAFGGLIAVRELSFSLSEGEILGLIGPNGSGKTTVLNLITGEFPADAGKVRFHGADLLGLRPFQICRRRVSRTFQLVRVFAGMTVRENVLVGTSFGSAPRPMHAAGADIEGLLTHVGLAERAGQRAGELTYIDQKRLELARALATKPALLLLDEWLAGLNQTELNEGIDLVRRTRDWGVSMILVEHVMDAIRTLCDRVVVMNAGRKIAEGRAQDVLRDPEVVSAYLGDEDEDDA